MKWLLVLLNLASAAAVIYAGRALASIHQVHSYSTYRVLEDRGALSKPPKPASSEDPVRPDGQYDVVKVLERIGGLDENLPVVTYTAAALFVLNACAFLVVWRKKPAAPAVPP